jgi:hypothetical protein
MREKYSDPIMKAQVYGIRDYFLRRFGNCRPDFNVIR